MRLTVDSNGDDFGQNPAIRCLESRDSLERVEFQVVGRETLGWVGLDIFNVKVVLLRDSEEDCGSGIALCTVSKMFCRDGKRCTYVEAVELAERHLL